MQRAIGVVGAGLMGCLAALVLARQGHRVVLFERRDKLLAGASRNNEGKVHLGFTYGLDPDGATPALMFGHGARFESLLTNWLGSGVAAAFLARRQLYAVHADSALDVAGVVRHMAGLGALHAAEAAAGRSLSADGPPVRRLGDDEMRSIFGPRIVAAHDVAEPTVDSVRLCALVAAAIAAEPVIEVRTGTTVSRILDDGFARVMGSHDAELGRFDLVIDAAWDGMPAIERQSGNVTHPLCLRAKAGFIAGATGLPLLPVSFTYGSFGDVVPQGDGGAYISWYPDCLMGFTVDLGEGAGWFERVEAGFDFDRAYERSCAAFRELIPSLVFAARPSEIRAGAILAAAKTDISDPGSGLHRRDRIGLYPRGRVIAVDTGKLTSAPQLAAELAAMIDG